MDNLARNAMLARQAGMSYGQWKALRPVVKVEQTIQEGWKPCEWCGKHFAPKQGKRFCDDGCREEAYRTKAKAQHTDYCKRWRKEKGQRKENKNEAESST